MHCPPDADLQAVALLVAGCAAITINLWWPFARRLRIGSDADLGVINTMIAAYLAVVGLQGPNRWFWLALVVAVGVAQIRKNKDREQNERLRDKQRIRDRLYEVHDGIEILGQELRNELIINQSKLWQAKRTGDALEVAKLEKERAEIYSRCAPAVLEFKTKFSAKLWTALDDMWDHFRIKDNTMDEILGQHRWDITFDKMMEARDRLSTVFELLYDA